MLGASMPLAGYHNHAMHEQNLYRRNTLLPLQSLQRGLLLACALLSACSTSPTVSSTAPVAAPVPTPQPVAGPDTLAVMGDETPSGFAGWLDSFGREAKSAGVRPTIVDAAVAGIRWQPRVIDLDRSQPEFTRPPWAYLDSAASLQRVEQGRRQRQQNAQPLDAASQRYGVPAEVITAIWGIESNYGTNFGGFSTLDALATLAFDGRRRQWARTELLAALRIIDQGDIAPQAMKGSWAGAMGHTQFLPSVFLAHAVDADGDGRRDIWGSIPDVAASTAHFLANLGWSASEPWGIEVRLPATFDHGQAMVERSAAEWEKNGVQAVHGGALPTMAGATLFTPAGARGPAFLIGRNFKALLRYNNSTSYALAVGVLSQRIAGTQGVQSPWPRDLQPLTREQTRQMQNALNNQGFNAGTPDGLFGPATQAALRHFQQSQALVPDGYPTRELLQRLLDSGTQ